MKQISTYARWGVLALSVVVLAACAETQFLTHTAKKVEKAQSPDVVGTYKVGKPYQIKGVWYYPAEDYAYDETGIASWYGPNFHGKKTANGETYNMNEMTAAHKTLPLPTYVRVTNLDNGRSLNLRINDRGPFVLGRIIDVSRRGAQLLGFHKQGTARVRVTVLANESRYLVARLRNDATLAKVGSPIKVDKMPKPVVAQEALAPPPGAEVSAATSKMTPTEVAAKPVAGIVSPATETPPVPQMGLVSVEPIASTNLYIQAGAFTQFVNANRAQLMLSDIGKAKIYHALVKGRDFYRVRLGPLSNVNEADQTLANVVSAGFNDARILIVKGE